MEYLETLKKLINGELVAAMQYKIVADSLIGEDNYNYLKEHFEEHYEEEMGHYTSLVTALMEREGFSNIDLKNIIENALPETEELASTEVEKAREFFIRSEENAIKAYEDFYKEIEEDVDLADLISGIIADEREHRLDFTRLDLGYEEEQTAVTSTEAEEEEEETSEDESYEEEDTYIESLHGRYYSKDFHKFIEKLGK